MPVYFSGDPNAQLLASLTTPIAAKVADEIEVKLPEWTATKTYTVVSGPVGLAVGIKTGVIRWCPTPDQTGSFTAQISDGTTILPIVLTVAANPNFTLPSNVGWISNVGAGNGLAPTTAAPDGRAFRGTKVGAGYNSIRPIVYLRGGTYPKNSETRRMAVNEKAFRDFDVNNCEFRPWGNERVLVRCGSNPLRTSESCSNVTITGLELRGDSDRYTYAEALANWWGNTSQDSLLNSNGFAIGGTGVTVRDCVVHEIMCQGIAFKQATDVEAWNNIVANSARWTFAGTTAIGQVGMLTSSKPVTEQACKMVGNFIFGVESRIISHVFEKGATHCSIDEGECFLAQGANISSNVLSNAYQGRFLIKNNFCVRAGKGIVANVENDVDVENNTLIEIGTTIQGRSKGLRGNKASGSTWRRNLVKTFAGDSGDLGSVYSFGHGDSNAGYIMPQFSDNYGNVDDGKESGITVTQNLFATANIFDPTPHGAIPANIGADVAHHIALVEKAKSYSVNLTIDDYWQTQDLSAQTKEILRIVPAGLSIDYTNWKNSLPWVDGSGKSHDDFDIEVTETVPGTLALYGVPANRASLTMTIVHSYPRP